MNLSRADKEKLAALLAEKARRKPIWSPRDPEFPDKITPQMMLVNSEADMIFYGGGVGGGKTYAAACLALTKAERTLILRRHFSEHEEIVNVFSSLVGAENIVGGTVVRFKNPETKPRDVKAVKITLGHLNNLSDWQKYQGRQFGLLIIDEATAFAYEYIQLITSWNRMPDKFKNGKLVQSARPSIKTILTFNPPITPEGLWITKPIAPWVDPNFRDHNRQPLKVASGEVLHVLSLGGIEYFFREPQAINTHPVTGAPLGDTFRTVSRTFIRAMLADNAYLRNNLVYRAKLQAMPEEWRRAMLDGEMSAQLVDQIGQIFKASAYNQCQLRWKHRSDAGKLPTSLPLFIGFDTAQGGKDDNCYFPIWEGGHVGLKGLVNGQHANDAGKLCDWLENEFLQRWNCQADMIPICIDAIGGKDFIYEWTRRHPRSVIYKFVGSEKAGVRGIYELNAATDQTPSTEVTNHAAGLPFISTGAKFTNKISAAYIRLGDATRHPSFAIELPPDDDLKLQLTSRRLANNTDEKKEIGINSKQEFISTFMKSPNEADALCMAYYAIDVVLHNGLLFGQIERFEEIQRARK